MEFKCCCFFVKEYFNIEYFKTNQIAVILYDSDNAFKFLNF